MTSKPPLTTDQLRREAADFVRVESTHSEPSLYGVTDGKAVGTYLEQKFQAHLHQKYTYAEGSSAKGIDFPELDVDIKVTSIRQPQSSCPFKDARQKIFGLGYALLVFVYEKSDDPDSQTATLNILHTVFIQQHRTGDYQITREIREILHRDGNKDDLMAAMFNKNLPVDEIAAGTIADEILQSPPEQGYLTISNALQWRLQYSRVIDQAGQVEGVDKVV